MIRKDIIIDKQHIGRLIGSVRALDGPEPMSGCCCHLLSFNMSHLHKRRRTPSPSTDTRTRASRLPNSRSMCCDQGGSTYKALQATTGCELFVLDKEGPPPGYPEDQRVIVVMGPAANVVRAQAEVPSHSFCE